MKILVAVLLALIGLNAWAQDNYSQRVPFGIMDKSGQVWGFTFDSPNEPGWTITKNGQGVKLIKSGASKDEGSLIDGGLMLTDVPNDPMSGFIEDIRKNVQKRDANDKTFKVTALDVVQDKGKPQCARSHVLREQRDADPAADDSAKKFVEQYSLSCGMSWNNKFGVEISYYQSYLGAHKDPAFQEKADRLFESVVLGGKSDQAPASAASFPLRFDGIYQSEQLNQSSSGGFLSFLSPRNDKLDKPSWSYLRFYPDGTVIEVGSTGQPNKLKKWFMQGHNGVSTGKVVLEGSHLSFSTVWGKVTVDYDGEIVDGQLRLHIHSRSTGYREDRSYTFVGWGAEQPAPADAGQEP